MPANIEHVLTIPTMQDLNGVKGEVEQLQTAQTKTEEEISQVAGRVGDVEQDTKAFTDVTPRDEEGRPYWSYGLETQEWTDPSTGEVHTAYIPKDGDLADIPEAYIPSGGLNTKFGLEMTVVNLSDEYATFAVSFIRDSRSAKPELWEPIYTILDAEYSTNAISVSTRAGRKVTLDSTTALVAGSLYSNFRLTLVDELTAEALGESLSAPAHPENFGIIDLKIYRLGDHITATYMAKLASGMAQRLQDQTDELQLAHDALEESQTQIEKVDSLPEEPTPGTLYLVSKGE